MARSIFHQTLACSSVVLDQFVMGLGWGWTAPTLLELQKEDALFKITTAEASWLASINEVGRILGPFVSPLLVDNIGRKYTLILVSLMYFMNWVLIIFARSANILCVARILFGIANGINDVVAGIYTTENCTPTFRGVIGGVIQLSFFGAVFVEYALSTYLSYGNAAIANAAISGGMLATLYFCRETPYFLVMKGKNEQAEKNLMWLQGADDEQKVLDELKKIKQGVQEEKQKQKSFKNLLSSTANFKAINIVVGMYILVAATGGMTFIAYSSLIFTSSEMLSVNEYVILFGIAQFLAVAISPFIVEKLNRRTLIIGCLLGITGCHVCSYVLLYMHNHKYDVAFYPWLIFASVTLYGALSSLMSPANYAIKGEILPLSVRAIGSSIAVIAQSITSFCVAKMFVPISEMYGMETNFLVYSIMTVITIIVTFYILPETRGKSLHDIQKSMKGSAPTSADEKFAINSGEKLLQEV